MNKDKNKLIVISGPTASGKTKLAVNIAYRIQSEIISADSRQVYKNLNIGSGKDLNDYIVNKSAIPYHLIDIVDVNSHYHVAHYMLDFYNVYSKIKEYCIPILCGGTGMYIQSVLQNFIYANIPVNNLLRDELKNKTHNELKEIFKKQSLNKFSVKADLSTAKRTIRAIEISIFLNNNPHVDEHKNDINYIFFALNPNVQERRNNIKERLLKRLENGLIEEAEMLIKSGVSHQRLQFLGLEYKFLSMYLLNIISKKQLTELLMIAIQQYAKRQMTYLRKMEKDGIKIIWLNQHHTIEQNTEFCLNYINNFIQ